MKTPYQLIYLSIFYLFINGDSSIAQDDPFADDGDYGLPKQIRIYTESYEVSALEFTKLMTIANKNGNQDELRNSLLAKAKKNHAKLISNHSVICRSGDRATVESIREFIHPVEYTYPHFLTESDSIYNKKGMKYPFQPYTPIAYETRNLGHTLEVSAILGEDGESIDLYIKAETVAHVGDNFISNFVAPYVTSIDAEPIFYNERLNTGLSLNVGEFLLASTFSPDLGGKTDHTRKILYFVRAEILTVGKK